MLLLPLLLLLLCKLLRLQLKRLLGLDTHVAACCVHQL
jgi:hypothetical protein